MGEEVEEDSVEDGVAIPATTVKIPAIPIKGDTTAVELTKFNILIFINNVIF